MCRSHDQLSLVVFFNDTATTEIYTLSLHDALPISRPTRDGSGGARWNGVLARDEPGSLGVGEPSPNPVDRHHQTVADRKSTRLNSSHANISYAVFCLKKKTIIIEPSFTFIVLYHTH